MRSPIFFIVAMVVGAAFFGLTLWIDNPYVYFAGYVVLQFIVLATAWNILGGYCGYVNFGSAAFFAVGAYCSVALHKFDPTKPFEYCISLWIPFTEIGFRECFALNVNFLSPVFPLPIPALIVFGGLISGIVGLGMGYLTLRLRGAFFAIATLALAVVLQTMVINWDYVGGARGAYIIRPQSVEVGGFMLGYVQYLFLVMIVLSVLALTVARLIERSRLGYGFATIRDDEVAAEACGVPTLRLKLIATTISGALMGMAGAPFPYYIGYLDPGTAFGLGYGVNSIAMPMIGGTTSWIGPLIGALLLGTLQQVATVTISSAVNLLIVGFLLIGFVIMAPAGIVGMVRDFLRAAASTRVDARAVAILLIATYCFLVGLSGVVLGLAATMGARNNAVAALGILSIALSLAYLACAYGLLKLESWAAVLTTIVLLVSVAFSIIFMWLERSSINLVLQWTSIAINTVAASYLQQRAVKELYQPAIGRRVTP